MNDIDLNELRRDAEGWVAGCRSYGISAKDLMRLFDHLDDLQDQITELTEQLEDSEQDGYKLEDEVMRFRAGK